MSLGLANPVGALALAAVAVLALLYLYDRRRRVVRVATFFLWRQLPASPLERRRRLRPDLLFVLQLALLLALIGGLLRPYLARPAGPAAGAALVLVLDVSASMQAREADGTRFTLARRRARAILDATDGDTMIVAAAERPHAVLGWTSDRARALARLESIEPLDVPGDLAGALALALGEAQARPGTRVAVVTDLPPAASGLAPADLAAVDFVQVGRTDDNLAVAGLAIAEPPFPGAGPTTATVLVRSYAARARQAVLEARVGGAVWTRRDLTLGPRAAEPVLLADPPGAGILEVSLRADDALAVDDRVLGWIAPAVPLDLAVATDEAETAHALAALGAAIPGARVEIVPLARAGEVLGPQRVTVVAGVAPAVLPRGASMLVAAPPAGSALCPSEGAVEQAAVVDWEDGHRLLAGIDGLQALEVGRARRLATPPWATSVVLAASGEQAFPLLVAGERDGARIACLGADLGSALTSDDGLPLLVLTLGTLRWLAEPRAAAALVVETGVPAAAGTMEPAAATDDGLRVAGTPPVVVAERAGVHRLGQRLVLASLLDDRESDIGRDGGGEWRATARASAPAAAPGRREFGRWLYLAAAALLALEWIAWRRRSAV